MYLILIATIKGITNTTVVAIDTTITTATIIIITDCVTLLRQVGNFPFVEFIIGKELVGVKVDLIRAVYLHCLLTRITAIG